MFDFHVWLLCFALSKTFYAIWSRNHKSSWTKMGTFRHTIYHLVITGVLMLFFPLLFYTSFHLYMHISWIEPALNVSIPVPFIPYPQQKEMGKKIYTRYIEYISSAPFPLCEVLWIFLLVSFLLLSSFYFFCRFILLSLGIFDISTFSPFGSVSHYFDSELLFFSYQSYFLCSAMMVLSLFSWPK